MPPKVIVATLTWNQKEEVLVCLRTLVKLDYPNYEIVVVDNGSKDGTLEAIRERYPQVHVVRHAENLGCAEGVNGEIRYALQAGADYLFIIANDAAVEPTTLSELIRVAEKDPRIGMVHPKVYHSSSPHRIWYARGAKMDWLHGRFYGFIQNVEEDGSFDEETEVDFFPGGFSLVRMEAVKKAGFLDPYYFIFLDDADWSLRIHRAGYTARYAPRARAWHKPSSSVGMESESFYYYRTRNRLYFVRRYAPRACLPFFFFSFSMELFFDTLPTLFLSNQRSQMKAVLLGVLDFLRGKRGKRDLPPSPSPLPLKGERAWGKGKTARRLRFLVKKSLKKKVRLRVDIRWNIGDEVVALPVFEALKKKYPDSLIEAEVRYPELLKGNPYVDLVNQGERFDPDLIFDLHREVRSRARMDFIRDVAGVSTWDAPKVYLGESELEAVRSKWRLENDTLRIAISPAARWFARRWPAKNWEELAERFMNRFGAQVLVLGKEEEPLSAGINLIGQTQLREAAGLLKQCHLFVGCDSGLVHLSVAVGTPTVGLFGPLNPSLLIPNLPHFFPLWTDLECRGCWPDGRMKYPDHCPKVLPDCMSSIPVSRVLERSEEALARSGIKTRVP